MLMVTTIWLPILGVAFEGVADDVATGEYMVKEIEPLADRPCASPMVTGIVLAPGVVAAATVEKNEKILSPGVTSPFVPSSENARVAEPPIEERSLATVSPVLGGELPGVTVTVSSVESPAKTTEGDAAPTPVGSVAANTLPVVVPSKAIASNNDKSNLFISVITSSFYKKSR